VRDAVQAANVEAFRTGMIVSGLLMIAGGLIAAIGIENPRPGQCVDFSFSVDDNATRLPAAPGDWRVFIVCAAELATHFTARVAGDRPVRWAPARDSRQWGCGGVGQLPRKS
jgi:hypothetical protein